MIFEGMEMKWKLAEHSSKIVVRRASTFKLLFSNVRMLRKKFGRTVHFSRVDLILRPALGPSFFPHAMWIVEEWHEKEE